MYIAEFRGHPHPKTPPPTSVNTNQRPQRKTRRPNEMGVLALRHHQPRHQHTLLALQQLPTRNTPPMNFLEWLLEPVIQQLNRIEGAITTMTASINQVRADYKAYAQELKDQRDAAVALAEQAAATAQENADALAAFVADDAQTDAAQLAEKEAQDAAAFQADLDELKAADEPTPPDDTPPDQTLPGDLPQ